MAQTLGLSSGVGEGQPNRPDDVKKVQMALNVAGCIVGMVDGACGANTRKGIRAFQAKYCSFTPDGYMSPGKGTDKKLASIFTSSGNNTTAILAVKGLVNQSDRLSGVKQNARNKVAQFAVKFGPITVNSGLRDLKKQAELMAEMTTVQLDMYGNGKPQYIKDIKALKTKTTNAVHDVLKKHYPGGSNPSPFISRHLQGRAVDISMKGWSAKDKARAKQTATSLGLTYKDETRQGILCFHVQC